MYSTVTMLNILKIRKFVFIKKYLNVQYSIFQAVIFAVSTIKEDLPCPPPALL